MRLTGNMSGTLQDIDYVAQNRLKKPLQLVIFGDEAFLSEPVIPKDGISSEEAFNEILEVGTRNGLKNDWLHKETITNEQLDQFGVSVGELPRDYHQGRYVVAEVLSAIGLLDVAVCRLDQQIYENDAVDEDTLHGAVDLMEELQTDVSSLQQRLKSVVISHGVWEALEDEIEKRKRVGGGS